MRFWPTSAVGAAVAATAVDAAADGSDAGADAGAAVVAEDEEEEDDAEAEATSPDDAASVPMAAVAIRFFFLGRSGRLRIRQQRRWHNE